MLAGRNGLSHGGDAAVGGLGVEIDRVARIAQRLVEIRRPGSAAGLLGELRQLRRVAADQDRIGHDFLVRAQLDAALLDDGHDRPHQVLVRAHPPGNAVEDDAEFMGCR